jgi:hypothetical protein
LSARRAAGALLAGLAWLVAAACSVVVDPDELQQGCAEGFKPCELEPGKLACVGDGEAEYGCARESCVPCTLAHAVEVCGSNGACAIGTCEPGYENCDLVAKNGCEVNLETSYDDCGSCGSSCEAELRHMPRARSAQCTAGRCAVDECEPGYADCDGAASNGCERALPETACGHCAGCPGETQCNVETRRCE